MLKKWKRRAERHDSATATIDGQLLSKSGTQVPALRHFAAFFRLGITAFGGPAMVDYILPITVGQ